MTDERGEDHSHRLSEAVGKATSKIQHSALPWVVLFATALVGLSIAIVLTAVSGEIYDDVSESDGIAGIDQPVLGQMIEWRKPSRDDAITAFTDLGSTLVMPFIAVAATGLLCWWWRRWTPAILMGIATTGSLLMTVVGKTVVDRARPDDQFAVPPYETSASFPSGHTLNSSVIFGMIAYLVICRAGSPLVKALAAFVAVALSIAMGMSRVYLGHHWLTDVLVAWTLGIAWLAVVITAHRMSLTVIRHRRQNHSSNSTQNALPSGSSSTTR